MAVVVVCVPRCGTRSRSPLAVDPRSISAALAPARGAHRAALPLHADLQPLRRNRDRAGRSRREAAWTALQPDRALWTRGRRRDARRAVTCDSDCGLRIARLRNCNCAIRICNPQSARSAIAIIERAPSPPRSAAPRARRRRAPCRTAAAADRPSRASARAAATRGGGAAAARRRRRARRPRRSR